MEPSTTVNESTKLASAWEKVGCQIAVSQLLFDNCFEQNTEVVSVLRKKIGSTLFLKNTPEESPEDKKDLVAILNRLKFFAQTGIANTATWIKVIRVDRDPDCEVIDVLIIFVLLSVPNMESVAEMLLRNQIDSGLLGEKQLMLIFETYYWAMRDYFDGIVKVAAKFSKYHTGTFSKFGTNLYKNLYYDFDLGCKQTVFEKILDHFASYVPRDVDCAIELLQELIKNNPEQMATHCDCTKRIIDYFDRLTLHQIRSIYSCLSILACEGGQKGEMLLNHLRSTLQNQVSNSNLKCRRIGIVGSGILVKHLAPEHDHTGNDLVRNK